jgi:predicted DsbA family dithiol-disulfide isomerase
VGKVLAVPLPLAGLLGFGTLLVLSLTSGERVAFWLRPMALTAGAVGLILILLQALIVRAWCPWCVVADTAGILVAAMGVRWRPAGPPRRQDRILWTAGAALVIVAPFVWARMQPPPELPPEVKAVWVPGKINIVEITDFECPRCQELHPVLEQFVREQGARVHFVRVVVAKGHTNTRTASRAYLCAVEQHMGDQMAERLYQARGRASDDCERLAKELGLDMDRYHACLRDPALNERIDQAQAWVEANHLKLPTTWIQEERLLGMQSPQTLQAALERAQASMQP